MMGVTTAQAWKAAREGGASFVGANCGIGIDAYIKVARELAHPRGPRSLSTHLKTRLHLAGQV